MSARVCSIRIFVMPRMPIQLIAVLLAIVSTVLSAPNSVGDDLKFNVSKEEIPSTGGYQNDSFASTANVSAELMSPEGPRTLIMFGLLRWLFGIFKAMIQPARNMYITMMPEISAFRCLSDSREFQNFMGFSGSDFEGYVYETPRAPYRRLPLNDGLSDDLNPTDQVLLNEVYDSEFQQNVHPDRRNFRENDSFKDSTENPVSEATQHRTDEVLKRIPRFIDEFASLLKEGQAMNCIMPYMRERVTRWLDG